MLGKNGCVDHCIKSGEAKLICRGHKGKKDKRFGKGKGKRRKLPRRRRRMRRKPLPRRIKEKGKRRKLPRRRRRKRSWKD